MNQLTCHLLELPIEIIELICSYLKFNTNLFITCKGLYGSSYMVQCCSGKHMIKLIKIVKRRVPTVCSCISVHDCMVCQCALVPMCIPTRSRLWWTINGAVAEYICNECHPHLFYISTFAFKVGEDGVCVAISAHHTPTYK